MVTALIAGGFAGETFFGLGKWRIEAIRTQAFFAVVGKRQNQKSLKDKGKLPLSPAFGYPAISSSQPFSGCAAGESAGGLPSPAAPLRAGGGA